MVWNRVRIWKTSWHTPTKISQEYPPGNCRRGYTQEPIRSPFDGLLIHETRASYCLPPLGSFTRENFRKTSHPWDFRYVKGQRMGGGGGFRWVLGLMFTRYAPLAFQSPYSILVYFVANYRPHLSHFLENVIFVIPIGHFLFIHLPCQSFKKVIQNLSSMDDNNPVEK